MSALPSPSPAPGVSVTLQETLAVVADELERTRVLGLRIEAAVCSLAIVHGADPGVASELQQLDLILQRVAALRDYLAHLGACCPPSQHVDIAPALQWVSLDDVKNRLAGAPANESETGWEML